MWMIRRLLSIVTLLLVLSTGGVWSGDDAVTVDGVAKQEALRLGERLYRDGILPSGEPMQAVVMGDIPVDGRMFTCDDCHQRSGLGSVEGSVITWPTNGKELSIPRRRTGAWRPPQGEAGKRSGRGELPPRFRQIADVRPAYTDETLARVLREGVDSAGRQLDPIMPRYLLDQQDMAIMMYYLKHLSVELAPGVDDTTMRFATVVTEGVPSEARAAMLSVLQAHIEVHNAQSRHQERRAKSGPFYKTEKYQAYRRWQLAVWELQGPRDTWHRQLEAHYQEAPVFALLGGIASGSWAPMHTFCEAHRIPCLFPVTDLPVISETDWYTLYFSKGLYQEGEGAAKYLHASAKVPQDVRLVQVLRKSQEGAALAQGFEETWERLGRPAAERRVLEAGSELNQRVWKEITASQESTIVLLWLTARDLTNLEGLVQVQNRPRMVVGSFSLLQDELSTIPDAMRHMVYLTYPYILPQEGEKRFAVLKGWLQARNIPLTNLEIQAKMYFLGWLLSGSVGHMRSEFFREYFLEGFDMMIDQTYAIPLYPRLTFGPGQRYASKGCYVVQLTEGPQPVLVRKSAWIIQ
jgi:hypothetical protein